MLEADHVPMGEEAQKLRDVTITIRDCSYGDIGAKKSKVEIDLLNSVQIWLTKKKLRAKRPYKVWLKLKHLTFNSVER